MNKRKLPFFLIALLVITFLVRIVHIEQYTEFLGDQGREGIVIYNAWKNKTVPQVGPPVSTGQHLGPFFYYLIAPAFIVGNFNPVVPVIFLILLEVGTVYVLFKISSYLWNKKIGYGVSSLYAFSPTLIVYGQTLWNPTPIPFFVSLLIWCYLLSWETKKYYFLIPIGVITAILVQLHYSTVIFIPLSSFIVLLLLLNKKYRKNKNSYLFIFLGLASFAVIFFPFLQYEMSHSFENSNQLITQHSSEIRGKREILKQGFEVMTLVSKSVLPINNKIILGVATVILAFSAILSRDKKIMLIGAFIFVGVAFVTFFVPHPPEHYVRFLIPFVFIAFGALLNIVTHYNFKIGFMLLGLLILGNVYSYVHRPEPKNDIPRTKLFVSEMLKDSNQEPFSFTLIRSRSFSDLHYRFFFLKMNTQPKSIESNEYSNLFIICEQLPCASEIEIRQMIIVQSMCFDPLCNRQYPKIALSNWNLTSYKTYDQGTIAHFTKDHD